MLAFKIFAWFYQNGLANIRLNLQMDKNLKEFQYSTPPQWRDLVRILTRKPRHASSFSLECTDFKNVTFEKIP